MSTEISKKIIQILLYEGGSMKKQDICKVLQIDKNTLDENILEIKNLLSILNLVLISNSTSLEISLDLEMNKLISKQKLETLKTDLSESALQTLSVILYRYNATKAEIDFVRGVDSSRSIKSLVVRGLIEKLEEKNRRIYIPSLETLKYLNLESVESIPDYAEISNKLKSLIEGE